MTNTNKLCRVHLSSLGFPIANDSQYGGTYKGPDQVRTHAAAARSKNEALRKPDISTAVQALSAAGSSQTELPTQASVHHVQSSNKRQKTCAGAAVGTDNSTPSKAQQHGNAEVSGSHNPKQEPVEDAQSKTQTAEAEDSCSEQILVPQDLQDAMCLNCPNLIPPGYPTDIHPLWLHAHRYTCNQWSFVCSKPEWASSSWTSLNA